MTLKTATPLALMLLLMGCDGSDDGDGADQGLPADYPTITQIEVQPATLSFFIGDEIQLKAVATFSDGQQRDITQDADWFLDVGGDQIVELVSPGKIRALADGATRVGANHATNPNQQEFGIAEVSAQTLELIGLSISPNPIQLNMDETVPLRALGTFNDGHAEEVTDRVTWTSSSPDVMRFGDENPNELTALANGFVQVTAELDGITTQADAVVACFYPSYPDTVQFNKTMPPLYWESAFKDGHKEFEFRLEDVYCDHANYSDVSIIAFVVGAGWCSACTHYTTNVLEPEKEALEDAGVMIVFLEAQDYDYLPTDSEFADDHLTRLVGSRFGIRVGSLDTKPVANYLTDETNGYIQAFPTVFVVRRSDMKIIADGTRSANYLPLLDIARSPEQDWSDPDSRFVNRCGGDDEEDSEPNNNPVDAPTIGEGSLHGGICNVNPDYYRVDIDGPWRLDLTFSHEQGNLDVWVWDEREDAPLMVDGEPIGGYSDDDNETLDYEGPALIRVEGVRGASAVYDLNISAR